MEGGALRPGRGDAARVRYTLEEIFLSVINSKNERELGESRESPQPAKGPGKIRAPVLHRKSVIYPSLVPSEEILDRPFWFTRVEKTRRRPSHVGSLLDWQFVKIADTWFFCPMWRPMELPFLNGPFWRVPLPRRGHAVQYPSRARKASRKLPSRVISSAK